MTTTSLHSQGPSFHVRSRAAALRSAVVTSLWLIILVGFVAQVVGGAVRSREPEPRAAAARLLA